MAVCDYFIGAQSKLRSFGANKGDYYVDSYYVT